MVCLGGMWGDLLMGFWVYVKYVLKIKGGRVKDLGGFEG